MPSTAKEIALRVVQEPLVCAHAGTKYARVPDSNGGIELCPPRAKSNSSYQQNQPLHVGTSCQSS